MEMLRRGIASHQALCRGWSTLSLQTARRAAAGSAISAILSPSLSARPSGILVCAFLTSFPRILHTSTQHSKHLPLPPKHLLSTQAGRHLSNIIMLSTTRQALMALAQSHVVQASNWTFFLGRVSFLNLWNLGEAAWFFWSQLTHLVIQNPQCGSIQSGMYNILCLNVQFYTLESRKCQITWLGEETGNGIETKV